MSRFLTALRLERLEDTSRDGRGTWQLLTPLVYRSDVAGRSFVVPQGFITDLASVPRLPFAYLLVGGIGHAAAVVHDWTYTSHEVSRDVADAVFREALRVLGISAFQAWLMYLGVRLGGASSWDAAGAEQPHHVEVEIITANFQGEST